MKTALYAISVLLTLMIIARPSSAPAQETTVNVKDFGAEGNGISEDQSAFEKAIGQLKQLGGGKLYIPAGTYIVTKHTVGAAGTIQLNGVSNIEIFGDGWDKSIIKLKPGPLYNNLGDTHVIKLNNASHITLRDLTIDGSRLTLASKNEQMHGLYLFNSNDILVQRVKFYRLRGDGVFLIGENGLTQNVTIKDSWFVDNGRSGIANQGGIAKLAYLQNKFELTSDGDIHLEPTGNRTGPADILIDGNVMTHSTPSLALTIAGANPSHAAQRVVVSNNTITGGSASIGQAQDVDFINNTISNNTSARLLDVRQYSQRIRINNNRFVGTGPELIHFLGPGVSGIHFEGNTVTQNLSSGSGIFVEGAGDDIELVNNKLSGASPVVNNVGINVRNQASDGITRHRYTLSGNCISNFQVGIAFSTHSTATRFSDVSITNNIINHNQQATGNGLGIRFANPSGPSDGTDFIDPLLVQGNEIDSQSAAPPSC